MRRAFVFIVGVTVSLAAVLVDRASAQANRPGFFVSSATGGTADLGGLAGADKLCQQLAKATSAPTRMWRAYLSTNGAGGVNARDRIGRGPWYNVKGQLIAQNVDELHTEKANINNDTALDEQGRPINAQGAPNRHDILTGSSLDGRATEMTCNNWTSSGAGSATLGHHDRLGFGKPGSPWNSAHPSKGCSADNLRGTGGAGLIYCFAAD
ncbi:MAG: Endostatin protein [Acidobacteria bacterium]|nr:Endostatin protein [Acidobacteriota bacterium]